MRAGGLSEGCQQRCVRQFFKGRRRINQPSIEERPLAAVPGVGMVIQRHVDSSTQKRGHVDPWQGLAADAGFFLDDSPARFRSEEHTSELQSLMRISYAVFCLKKKK